MTFCQGMKRWNSNRLMSAFLLLVCPVVLAKPALYAAMDNWPPFIIAKQTLASDSGVDGIDWELLQELGARTGIQINPLPYPQARGLKELKDGKIDLMTSVIKSPERNQYLGYLHSPYYQCHVAFYAQPEMAKQIKTYEDLKNKRIGYASGLAYFEPFDSDHSLIKIPTLNENKLPLMLLKRNHQVFVGTDCQINYALKEQGLSGKIIQTIYKPGKNVDLYIAYSKAAGIENEVLKLDQALDNLIREGWISKMAKGYFLAPIPETQ